MCVVRIGYPIEVENAGALPLHFFPLTTPNARASRDLGQKKGRGLGVAERLRDREAWPLAPPTFTRPCLAVPIRLCFDQSETSLCSPPALCHHSSSATVLAFVDKISHCLVNEVPSAVVKKTCAITGKSIFGNCFFLCKSHCCASNLARETFSPVWSLSKV